MENSMTLEKSTIQAQIFVPRVTVSTQHPFAGLRCVNHQIVRTLSFNQEPVVIILAQVIDYLFNKTHNSGGEIWKIEIGNWPVSISFCLVDCNSKISFVLIYKDIQWHAIDILRKYFSR